MVIGTNYHIDQTFLDALSIKHKRIATALLNDMLLSEFISARDRGLTPEISAELAIKDPTELTTLLDACILTKITYFDHSVISIQYVALLIREACKAMKLPMKPPMELHEMYKHKHHVFAVWMLNAHNRIMEHKNKGRVA